MSYINCQVGCETEIPEKITVRNFEILEMDTVHDFEILEMDTVHNSEIREMDTVHDSGIQEMDTVHLFQIRLARENFSFYHFSPKIQF